MFLDKKSSLVEVPIFFDWRNEYLLATTVSMLTKTRRHRGNMDRRLTTHPKYAILYREQRYRISLTYIEAQSSKSQSVTSRWTYGDSLWFFHRLYHAHQVCNLSSLRRRKMISSTPKRRNAIWSTPHIFNTLVRRKYKRVQLQKPCFPRKRRL